MREFPVPPDIVAVVEEIKAPDDEEEQISLSTSMGRMVMSHCREISELLPSSLPRISG